MGLSCNATYNLKTGVALFLAESSHVFLILDNTSNVDISLHDVYFRLQYHVHHRIAVGQQ